MASEFERYAQSTDDLARLAEPSGRLEVELRPDGRLRAPAQETRALLRDRLRHAEALPTGSGWAVFRSLAPSSAPELLRQAKEVVAAGTLGQQSISLIDFIGFLASGGQTGVLTASHENLERSVFFHQGDVVWAASNSAQESLGALLLRLGKITREQLGIAMRDGEHRLGRACVERGYLAPHELWRLVKTQLTEVFGLVLRMEEGVWSFARVASEVLAESQFHMSTQGLLVDGLRRLDEMLLYRQRVRSVEAKVRRIDEHLNEEQQENIKQHGSIKIEQAEQILGLLTRPASIRELMRTAGVDEFAATRLVYHLLRANVVELVAPSSRPHSRPGREITADTKEILSIYSMALKEMLADVRKYGRGEDLLQAARAFLDDESGSYANLLAGVELSPEGLLFCKQLDGRGLAELSDALSELLFFVLFQATEILGRRRGDDLARRVKLIHAMLVKQEEMPR